MKHDGFRAGGRGVYVCGDCGKKTRRTNENVTDDYCIDCEERQMHENSHADNDFKNDDCGDEDCLIKHYTKAQRWWLK